jgi:predicted enzyme related to lactoylglutathione lyase
MFTQAGKPVAGLMRMHEENHPTVWATYISVDDADEIAAKVGEAGGQTVVPPMDVMDIGRMAVFLDPAHAAFGVWQPKAFTGAELVNEPNSLCWNEVLTRDKAKALEFYPAVFSWKASSAGFDPSGGYVVWERPDGQQIGGLMEMTDEHFPAQVPSHWAVTFAVADTDAIVAKATELGATPTMPAMDCPIGRFAGFADPQGAPFSVMQLNG